jgi:hypothetical protein
MSEFPNMESTTVPSSSELTAVQPDAKYPAPKISAAKPA